jgi:hypothetical protein
MSDLLNTFGYMDVLELAQRLSPEDQYLLMQELSRNRTEIKNEKPEIAVFVSLK